MSASNPSWLAIDAGNTRLKWAVGRPGHWQATGAADTVAAESLAEALPAMPAGTRAVFCCVAGEATERAVMQACARLGIPLQRVGAAGTQLGVTNGYRDPSQLGADRWVALVAAHRERATNQLVVNAGTALTVDALAADGRFLGGVIAPGVQLMREALVGGTAKLRPAGGKVTPLPLCTDDAIATGTSMAAAGAIDRMARNLAEQGLAISRVVLSGGGADALARQIPYPLARRPHLVLDGLGLIGETLPWPA